MSKKIVLTFLALFILCNAQILSAGVYDDDVLNIFSKLMPRFILMSNKKYLINKDIEICILHDKMDADNAELLTKKIAQNYPNGIKQYKINVVPVEYLNIEQCKNKQLAFLFNQHRQSISKSVQTLNQYKILTISYEPDYLQEGVAVSLFLGRKIVPLLNMQAIRENDITLDNLLIRVSKIYREEK